MIEVELECRFSKTKSYVLSAIPTSNSQGCYGAASQPLWVYGKTKSPLSFWGKHLRVNYPLHRTLQPFNGVLRARLPPAEGSLTLYVLQVIWNNMSLCVFFMRLFLLWIYKLGHKRSFGPCKQTQWHNRMTHPPVTSKAWAWHDPDHLFCLLGNRLLGHAWEDSFMCQSPALCHPGRVDLKRWGTKSESKKNSWLCWKRKRSPFFFFFC